MNVTPEQAMRPAEPPRMIRHYRRHVVNRHVAAPARRELFQFEDDVVAAIDRPTGRLIDPVGDDLRCQ